MQKKPVFVDLFKHFRVFSLENCQKQGEVRVIFNEAIQRKVISLKGDVSLTNFLRFPSKSVPANEFSLSFFYVFASFPVTSLCSMTFTVFSGNQSFYLAFSSLFKEIRLEKGNLLQIPLKIPNNSWTILVIDAKNYVQEFFKESTAVLKFGNIKLCANLLVKTVVLSETLYKIETLPAEIRLKGMRNPHDFREKFNYILLTPSQISTISKENKENKENCPIFPEKSQENLPNLDQKPAKRSSFQTRFPSQPKKRVTFDVSLSELADLQPNSRTPCPTPLDLHEFSSQTLTDALHFQLSPCPIMELSHIHGISGAKRLSKAGPSKLAYLLGPNLVILDILSKRQKRWFSPSLKENLEDFLVLGENSWIFLLSPKKLSLVDRESLETLAETPLALKSAGTLSYARLSNGFRVFLTGTDEKSRNCFNIFDVSAKNPGNLALKHKQLSDFEVQRAIALSPQSLVTLSPRLLRLWTFKSSENSVLVAKNVALDSEIPGKHGVFLTNMALSRENRKLLVGTSSGMLILLSFREICDENQETRENSQEKVRISVDSLYKLADQAIISIDLLENRLIATSFADARLVVWREDLTKSVCEGKLDSQSASLQFLDEDTLIVATLNGSLGVLALSSQKFRVLLRTHEENISKLLYNPTTKQLISASKRDKTVRVWEFHAKSRQLSESYEFRCLDHEVSAVCLKKTANLLLCGLENGNVRAFDLNSYALSWEKPVFAPDSVDVIACDSEEKRLLFGSFTKDAISLRVEGQDPADFPCRDLRNCGFDELGLYFFAIFGQGFEIALFSTESLENRVNFQTKLQICAVSFSSRANDVFLIDVEGNLSQYSVADGEFSLRRVLKERDFCEWIPSQNTMFALSLHKDGCLKVWDYEMRGGTSPDCQVFAAGEPFSQVLFSNDQEKLVFAAGERSHGVYVWQFLNEIQGNPQKTDFCGEIFEKPKNVSVFQEIREEKREKNQEKLEEMKENRQKLEIFNGNINRFEENKEISQENPANTQENPLFLLEQASFQAKPKEFPEEISVKARNPKETKEIDVPLLGKHLFWTSQIGFDTKSLQNSLLWNRVYQFLAYISGQSVIITYLQTPKVQKKLDFSQKILFLQQTTQENSLIIALDSSEIAVFSCTNLQNLANFPINSCRNREFPRLKELAVSPCGHYLLTLQKSVAEILVKVWEISTGAQISCSFVKQTAVSDEKVEEIRAKWSPNPRNLEFCVFSRRELQLWRLNPRRSLEYQGVSLPNSEETLQKYGEFSCACYFSRGNCENPREFLLLGSSKGSVFFVETCSGALLCMLAGVSHGNIREIQADAQRIIVISGDHLLNFFEFPNKSEKTPKKPNDFEEILEILQQNPRTLALDSKLSSVSGYKSGQCVAISWSGVLWLVDFHEQCTVKLFGSHKTDCTVRKLVFTRSLQRKPSDFPDFPEKIPENPGLLVSMGEDSSVKLWDSEALEPVCELLNTKPCLCCENFEDLGLLVNGYSDGSLGFFDYRAGFHRGYSKILGNNRENVQFFALCVLQASKNNFLVAIDSESVMLGYLTLTKDREIHLELGVLVENLEFPVAQIFVNPYEELLEWGFLDISGKITVWTRKDLSRVIKHVLTNVQGVELYLVDSYRPKAKENPRSLGGSAKNFPRETARFVKEKDCYLTLIMDGSALLLRNFRDHVNLRMIELNVQAFCFVLNENRGFLYAGGLGGCVSMYDYKIGLEVDRYEGDGLRNVEALCWVKLEEGKEVLAAGQENSITFLSAF